MPLVSRSSVSREHVFPIEIMRAFERNGKRAIYICLDQKTNGDGTKSDYFNRYVNIGTEDEPDWHILNVEVCLMTTWGVKEKRNYGPQIAFGRDAVFYRRASSIENLEDFPNVKIVKQSLRGKQVEMVEEPFGEAIYQIDELTCEIMRRAMNGDQGSKIKMKVDGKKVKINPYFEDDASDFRPGKATIRAIFQKYRKLNEDKKEDRKLMKKSPESIVYLDDDMEVTDDRGTPHVEIDNPICRIQIPGYPPKHQFQGQLKLRVRDLAKMKRVNGELTIPEATVDDAPLNLANLHEFINNGSIITGNISASNIRVSKEKIIGELTVGIEEEVGPDGKYIPLLFAKKGIKGGYKSRLDKKSRFEDAFDADAVLVENPNDNNENEDSEDNSAKKVKINRENKKNKHLAAAIEASASSSDSENNAGSDSGDEESKESEKSEASEESEASESSEPEPPKKVTKKEKKSSKKEKKSPKKSKKGKKKKSMVDELGEMSSE